MIYNQIFGAFSQDSNSPLSRISQANSSISLDPFAGCSLDCVYCYRHNSFRDTNENYPKRLFSDEQIIDALIKHQYFIPHKTVISLQSGSTEPFLPEVKDSTFALMKLLVDKGFRNPFWIVTKKGIPKECFQKLKYITDRCNGVVISVCYSDMPQKIEPYKGNRLLNIEEAKKAGAKISLHFRPIVSGWNSNKKNLENVLKKALLFDCICIGGLRLLEGMKNSIISHKVKLSKLKTDDLQKEIPKKTQQQIFAISRKIGLKIPIFLHASCAISYLIGMHDYNLTSMQHKQDCCDSTCPSIQRKKCAQNAVRVVGDKSHLLSKLNLPGKLLISNEKIVFSKKLEYAEERATIHHVSLGEK